MTRLVLATTVALVCAAAPAHAQRTRVTPYIEASQVLVSDLTDGGDLLTYSTLGAGIDATVNTRRVEVQVSYQYQHRFAYDKDLADDSMHSGLAQARARITPELTLEAGAIATRGRSDIRGDALGTAQGNVRNSSQVFSAYAGPSIATRVGPMFANAAYRFGYTKVEAPNAGTGVPAGAPPLDRYDDSTVHVATASVGAKAGTVLPVGVTASGSFTREDAGQLDQRFEGKFARGDVVVPVSRGVAIVGGVGYEKIEVSQRDALVSGGRPVIDGNGRFVTDPNSPRRLAYDFDGVFWDAGVIWRPSSRTFLEARAGRRYGSMSYTGSATYQIGPGSGIQIGVYDSVETFGQQLNGSLTRMPASFATTTDPFGNQFSGCIYGTTGAAAGGCLNQVFASTVTSAYRSRGVTGVAVLNRGGTRIGMGGGYARRTFLTPQTVGGVSIDGTSDESVFGQLFASSDVGRNGQVSTSVFASWYNSDLTGAQGILGYGANTAYTHSFGPLGATASLGLFGFDREGDNNASAQAQALVGLRYGF
ncbi:hypothetical protein RZN05_08690 [Sphingomonas sp. HF-S4]|uniref:Preprotein translocase subunit YajC n=1 Tax=Sphingomonas agrestis TaxID=3080540 RepID=A0ABU3Y6N4_9SPHN|nr:hypothetical protein [Sphingomonas sp. HF-S4]MDV3457056.1 hypothetical protein [Sphingomonas sp. HF-S4]